MSQEKVQMRRSYTKGVPSTQTRTTVINRTAQGSMPMAASRSSMQMRMSMGHAVPNYQAGQVSKISQENVSHALENRAKEKSEMNQLNNRFASYIEKVRFLEAQNKALVTELERLKKCKAFDPSSIKQLFIDEIEECKGVIKDMSEDKAKSDAKMVDLEDEIENLRRDLAKDEDIIKQLQKKNDTLDKENADLDGELSMLRRRVQSLEEEVARLKNEKITLQNDMQRLRSDLQNETEIRLKKEFEYQCLNEDLDLENKYLKEVIKELETLVNRDVNLEMSDVWKDQIKNVTKELQMMYEQQVQDMCDQNRRSYESQLQAQLAGMNRDNNDALMAKEETKTLKGKMAGLTPRIAELEAENQALRAKLAALQDDYDTERRDHDDDNSKQQSQIQLLQEEIEKICRELDALQESKLSLELEISCYRKLLEAEENSMAKAIQESSGARSAGAQQLSDLIGGGGGGGSSSEQKSTDNGSKAMSEMSNKIIVQRTCKGDIAIENAQPDGSCVTLKNTTKKEKDMGTVNLEGWVLKKFLNNKEKYTYTFKNITLAKGHDIKLFSKGAEGDATDKDIICDHYSWGMAGSFTLYDKSGSEKATLSIKTAQ